MYVVQSCVTVLVDVDEACL